MTALRILEAVPPPPVSLGPDTPLNLYAAGLTGVIDDAGAEAMLNDGVSWALRYDDGHSVPLRLQNWCADEIPGDLGLIDRCSGATLDVGCGPGRLAAAVGSRALPVLGLDISPAALRIARGRGALVMERSVFDRVPGAGRWRHVLLADGNLGIGGDPVALLQRCRELISSAGTILTEVDAPGTTTYRCLVRIESTDGRHSARFPWAHVAANHVEAVAERAGLRLAEIWMEAGRWFAELAQA